MKKILSAAVIIAFLGSCSISKNTIKTNKLIAVEINLNTVIDDKVEVVINPKKIKEETITYHIPAIVPGTYVMSNYGKFISDFKAFDYDGNEMSIQKLDANSWQINNAKKMDKLSYWVDDTFDTEQDHAIYVMAGTNIEEGKNFLLNLPGFVGYFKEKKETPYLITVTHPSNLYETSSLINNNISKKDNTKDFFTAARYDEISDNPIMYAPLNNVSFNVDGIEVTLAVYSPNNVHQAADMEADLKKMMQAQSTFLKGFKTTKEYNILLYLFDSEIHEFSVFGALEHLSSTTVVYPESYSKKQLANGMINGTISHEFFHIVSPLSVHSEEIHSFDFNEPNMSMHLWMYEGVTEYFANLFQVNQGLISEQEFVNKINEKINASSNYDDTMPFTKMSKNILEPAFARNYGNVYQKGALIGMCIDIILREESKGLYGIRNLMKDLSEKYGALRPFKDNEIIEEIVRMTYPSVGEFFTNHVIGTTPIDYFLYFEKTGIHKSSALSETSYFIDSQNQPFISVNKERKLFFTKRTNSGLTALGTKENDLLKSVNGEDITLQNINQIIGKSFQWKASEKLNFEVERDGKIIQLNGEVIVPKSEETILKIKELPENDPKALLRKAWLKG